MPVLALTRRSSVHTSVPPPPLVPPEYTLNSTLYVPSVAFVLLVLTILPAKLTCWLMSVAAKTGLGHRKREQKKVPAIPPNTATETLQRNMLLLIPFSRILVSIGGESDRPT